MVHRRLLRVTLAAAALSVAASSCGFASAGDDVVRVYSGRHYDLERAFQQFAEETGIGVEFLFGSDAELRERIRAEGAQTQADVYMTVDAGNLYLAAEQDVFRPLDSPTLVEAVPAHLRDPDGLWFGLSMRARTLVYHPDRVDPAELSTYEDLTDPRWKGRLCMRRSTNVYTQSLIASLVAHHGYEDARAVVAGWLDNDVDILGSDVLILDTIAKGGCDVGISNHYYLARLLEDDPDFPVKLLWANQPGTAPEDLARGVHVNVSGAGVTRHADNPDLAQRLLEWLATEGQRAFTHGNHEYPANPGIEPDPLVASEFGTGFDQDPLNAAEYGSLNRDAIRLMDEVGYE